MTFICASLEYQYFSKFLPFLHENRSSGDKFEYTVMHMSHTNAVKEISLNKVDLFFCPVTIGVHIS